ncbi:MAG TPA: hypothetical protein VK939_12120 [Longimicrobiales bacterium]|nr:hypothetical protein [Longimicrobiales bacterium]
MDISSAAVIILVGLVTLRWVIIGVGAALLLRPVRSCPACFGPTLMLHRRWLRRLAPWLEWRWCAGCGWQGPARRITERDHLPAATRVHGVHGEHREHEHGEHRGHPVDREQHPNS